MNINIYEIKNGKGFLKKYNEDGELIFEGEYLNGERNGKGKENDDDGKYVFEGEYLYGKKWNGKGYNINNDILYELKIGKGYLIESNDENKIIFEGEYLNGERNGKGREYKNNKFIFEGEYLNGERNGKGREFHENGRLKFSGTYLNGKLWNCKINDKINNNIMK